MSSSETVVYDDVPIIQPPELPDAAKEVDSECFIATTEDVAEKAVKTEPETEEDEILSDGALQLSAGSETPEKPESDEKPKAKAVKKTQAKEAKAKTPAKSPAKRGRKKKLTPTPKAKKTPVLKPVKSTPVIKKEPEAEETNLVEPTLPTGWWRKVVQRQSGASAGKYDVYIYSPDNIKFRSRTELSRHLDSTNSSLFIDQFDFTVKKVDTDPAQRPKETPSSSKKQQPSAKKPSTAISKSASPVTKRKSGTGTKLVVKLDFNNSGRRSIKKPARYSTSSESTVTEKTIDCVKTEPSVSVKSPKPKMHQTKKPGRPPLSETKKGKKQTNSKSTKSVSASSAIQDAINADLEVLSAQNNQASDEKAELRLTQSENGGKAASQPRKRALSSPKAPPAKRGRKPKATVAKVEKNPTTDQSYSEEAEREETAPGSNVEKFTEPATLITEDNTIAMDVNDTQEVQTENVSDMPVFMDESEPVAEAHLPEEVPIKGSQSDWDVLPSDSPKSKSANSDLYSMVKNVCVRALWKIK